MHEIDPTQAVRNIATFDELLDESVAQPRFNMGLLSAFAIAATILACIGIYGVVSYSVAQRVIEVGIRMAFGATRKQISYLFIRRTLAAALIGVLIGGITALFVTRLLRAQLYGVPPNHLLTFDRFGSYTRCSCVACERDSRNTGSIHRSLSSPSEGMNLPKPQPAKIAK